MRTTNGLAVAALVLGILGGVVLSIVFGFVALRQIRRRDQKGRGMAIAGIVLGFVWVAVLGFGAYIAITSSVQRDASGEITRGGSVTVEELQEGDCVVELRETLLLSVPVAPCSEPHAGQVYGSLDVPSQTWPGDESVERTAEQSCVRFLERYPEAYRDESLGVFFLRPTEDSWQEGDRKIVCVAEHLDGESTGSIID